MNHLSLEAGWRSVFLRRYLEHVNLVRNNVKFLLLVPIALVDLAFLKPRLSRDLFNNLICPVGVLKQKFFEHLDLGLCFSLSLPSIIFASLLVIFPYSFLPGHFIKSSGRVRGAPARVIGVMGIELGCDYSFVIGDGLVACGTSLCSFEIDLVLLPVHC